MPHGVCSCELLAGSAGRQMLLPATRHAQYQFHPEVTHTILPAEHSLGIPIRNVQSQLLPPFLPGTFMGGEALTQAV